MTNTPADSPVGPGSYQCETQRLAAYGAAVRDGHILLARASASSDFPGAWSLPGGGVDHGEHPQTTVEREYAEETGLRVVVGDSPQVFSDVAEIPAKGIRLHHVRFCYPVQVLGGTLRDEIDGTTDHVEWVPFDRALTLPPIAPFVTEVVGAMAARSSQDEVVTICGSGRFRVEIEHVTRELLLEGAVVLAPEVFTGPIDDTLKAELDRAHRVKIALADRVIVVARNGYIGESTASEIVYATDAGKTVEYRGLAGGLDA